MRYRLPIALAAVKGQARSRDSLWSPLTAASVREWPCHERHGHLCVQYVCQDPWPQHGAIPFWNGSANKCGCASEGNAKARL